VLRRQGWMARASCVGLWAIFDAAVGSKRQRDTARAICAGCPVSTECGQWAAAEELGGVFAGRHRAARRTRSGAPDPTRCGEAGNYRKGCRCGSCTAAWAAYRRAEKKRTREMRMDIRCRHCGDVDGPFDEDGTCEGCLEEMEEA